MSMPIIPSSIDSLAIHGIVPYDVNSYLLGQPSQALKQIPAQFNQPAQGDTFNNSAATTLPQEKNGWKTFGNIVIAAIAATAMAIGIKASKVIK